MYFAMGAKTSPPLCGKVGAAEVNPSDKKRNSETAVAKILLITVK